MECAAYLIGTRPLSDPHRFVIYFLTDLSAVFLADLPASGVVYPPLEGLPAIILVGHLYGGVADVPVFTSLSYGCPRIPGFSVT